MTFEADTFLSSTFESDTFLSGTFETDMIFISDILKRKFVYVVLFEAERLSMSLLYPKK